VIESFSGVALRGMRTHKLRSVLTGLGVVLGVGMVFAVLVLVGTIHQTFTQLIDSAYGTRSLIVSPRGGGMVSQRTLATIRSTPGVKSTGQSIGGSFIRLDKRGRPIRGSAGIMWVAGFDNGESPYDFQMLAGHPARSGPEVVLEKNWARDHHLAVGGVVRAASPTGTVSLRVVGVFGFSSGLGFGGQGLAGLPLAYARRVMNQPQGWMDVSITTTDKDKATVASVKRRLQRELGNGVRVQSPGGLEEQATSQLKALNIVLYFFSGVALFVGGFLILNSFNMTVLQRIREIGTLRTLGATRRMIVGSVLAEALLVGAAGTLVGLGLGFVLAQGLVAAMRGLGMPVGGVSVGVGSAVVAIVLGLAVTVAGALRPARRAGRLEPIRAVLGDAGVRGRPDWRRALVGLALFLPGCIFGGRFWMGGGNGGSTLAAILGIGMTMALFAGIVLAAPFLIMPVLRGLAAPLRRISPTGGRLAFDSASGNPLRTAATAAALTIGLSVFVVNSVFSSSFLGTVREQVDRSFARDFTVQSIGGGVETGEAFQLAPSVATEIARLPGARVVSSLRARLVELPGTHGAANGLAIGIEPRTFGQVDKSQYGGASARAALAGVARGGAIVGAALASADGLRVGSTITLRGAAGTVRAPVVAVLHSVTLGTGLTVELSQATQQAVYGPMNDTQVLVKAGAGHAKALEARTQSLLERRYPNLEMLSSVDLKRHIQHQMDQQFGLFNAIIFVAVLVSLLGVINTLAMSVLERTREIGVLRALGSSRWLVRSSLLDESLLITLAGALVGIVTGLVIGAAWIAGLGDLIPGISFRFPIGATLLVAAVAVVLGTLAAVLPARRAARIDVIRALTYE
jgi:putative ABC transport system permease protein